MSASRNFQEEPQKAQAEPQVQQEISRADKIKIWLKKNWILFVSILLLSGLYVGLQSAKNMLQAQDGRVVSFNNPAAPDLQLANQDKENAQTKQDRFELTNQKIGQVDAQNDTHVAVSVDTQSHFTHYSVAKAYQQKPISSTPAEISASKKELSSERVTPSTPAEHLPVHRLVVSMKKEKEKKQMGYETNKYIDHSEGFNTVVLQHPTTVHSENQNLKPKSDYIKAAVYGSQTIRSGSAVRVRLLEATTLDGIEVPANSICMGIAMLGANRVSIALTSVQVRGQQFGIKKVVCDKDLIPGIAFVNENALEQNARQQRNASIDQTTNAVMSNIPYGTGVAGVAVATGTGIVRGVSQGLRYGGIQKRAGEIQLEEGYKVFIIN